jgi:6-phosphogluconolactonase
MSEIIVAPNPQSLAHESANLIASILSKTCKKNGQASLALAGGSTPRATYEKLSRLPVPWECINLFWSDERLVSPASSESNFLLARETLLDAIQIPNENVHPVPILESPQESAKKYQDEIELVLGKSPQLDVVLLGMGRDGHTASLFPNSQGLKFIDAGVVANWVESLEVWRITFTAELINLARHVLILVNGNEKAERVRNVIQGSFDPENTPVQLINPSEGTLYWLLDQDAASKLDPKWVTRRVL